MAHVTIVLGAGIGGIVVANELRKRSSRSDRIVVIDRDPVHTFAPSLLWLAVGKREARDFQRPVRRMLRRGVEFIAGNIESIDASARSVVANGKTFVGDAMVIALGAELAPDLVPGLAEAGHNIYTLAGAQALRDALREFAGGRVLVLTAGPLYKCPAAPYEAAMLIEAELRRRGIREKSALEMCAAEPAPMGVAGPAVSGAVTNMLHEKGIRYSSNRQVLSVDPRSRLVTFADGSSTAYDLLAYVPPHRAPTLAAASGLADRSGWIPVDRSTLETSFPGLYAIGDITTIPLSMGKPLPKAGVFAHAQGRVVARAIAERRRSQASSARFDGHGACFVESGDGKAAIGSGDFYAEPTPKIALKPPSLRWHIAKILFEKLWLMSWK